MSVIGVPKRLCRQVDRSELAARRLVVRHEPWAIPGSAGVERVDHQRLRDHWTPRPGASPPSGGTSRSFSRGCRRIRSPLPVGTIHTSRPVFTVHRGHARLWRLEERQVRRAWLRLWFWSLQASTPRRAAHADRRRHTSDPRRPRAADCSAATPERVARRDTGCRSRDRRLRPTSSAPPPELGARSCPFNPPFSAIIGGVKTRPDPEFLHRFDREPAQFRGDRRDRRERDAQCCSNGAGPVGNGCVRDGNFRLPGSCQSARDGVLRLARCGGP